jgi:hypothetical protein
VTDFVVVTPSYAPDFELCRELDRSVLRWTPPSVTHHIITPGRDRALFAPLASERTRLWTVTDFLPRRMVPLPGNLWVNLRRPFPPVRGWVQQQVVKLQAAMEIGASVVVLADSDVLFVRPVTAETFRIGGKLRFYRLEAEIDERLPRHRRWHAVARRLLGLPPPGPLPLPDYISAFNVWDRQLARAMRERVEDVSGRPFADAVAGELHISEFILYGVFVDEVLGAAAGVAPTDDMLCHSYWDESPLDAAQAARFVQELPADHVALMISAKSRTPLDVRREAVAGLGHPPGSPQVDPPSIR